VTNAPAREPAGPAPASTSDDTGVTGSGTSFPARGVARGVVTEQPAPTYQGEISPIGRPVELAYGPTPRPWRITSTELVELRGEPPRRKQSVVVVEATPRPGGELAVRERVEQGSGDDAALDGSRLSFVVGRRGGVREVDGGRPGMVRTTQERFRATGALTNLASLQFPRFKPGGYAQSDIAQASGIAMADGEGRLVGRLAGATDIGGRPAWLIEETGDSTSLLTDGSRQTLQIKGWWAMDRATGIAVAGEQLSVTKDQDGDIVGQRYSSTRTEF
jgi:hypothetical protein